ncbi:hypothetical protein K435DRAFT_786544 [Dendrothele bispora CBS 962.96]|uniref:Uncharacterized protein n=1 Tax=Dendrothele bispora (strain CBS 962.96) TaxID=1314807 RepID=A0A4S8KQ14_DENBC|nr:hypothetical protein K435DRAFT_786544 [Dendrothele bispora CBS 962.96]
MAPLGGKGNVFQWSILGSRQKPSLTIGLSTGGLWNNSPLTTQPPLRQDACSCPPGHYSLSCLHRLWSQCDSGGAMLERRTLDQALDLSYLENHQLNVDSGNLDQEISEEIANTGVTLDSFLKKC